MKLQILCFICLVTGSFGRPNTPVPDVTPTILTTPTKLTTTAAITSTAERAKWSPSSTAAQSSVTPTPSTTTAKPPAIISKTSSSQIKDDKRIHDAVAETIHKTMNQPKIVKPLDKEEEVKRPVPLYIRNRAENPAVVVEKLEMKKIEPEVTRPVLGIGKANIEKVEYPATNGHRGIAVPMTMDEIEREMEDDKPQKVEASTPKQGLSTWILLSGNGPTVQPEKGEVEVDKKIDKIARISDTENEKQKLAQINKRRIEERMKARLKLSTTTTTTTTTEQPQYEYEDEEYEEDEESAEPNELEVTEPPTTTTTTKQTTKKPQGVPAKKKQDVDGRPKYTTKKPKRTTITTTTPKPTIELEEITQKLETTTMLILEPKDAGFDLPSDRAPTAATKKKRPAVAATTNNKTKKKPAQKKKKPAEAAINNKNNTKTGKPPKKKQNPMSTQIYNYLAREVMPTVGVGLVGLVVTAGLATYLLGSPLTALRRSYDITDRKDDLYQFNNEEYAGADGQNEEEMFGKVIAGMPASSLYRNNIRYPSPTAASYRPNPNQVYQAGYTGYSKYGPYNRYRYTGPAAAAGYRPVPPTTQNFPAYKPQSQPQAQYRYNGHGMAESVTQTGSETPNVKTVYAQSQPSYGSELESSPVYATASDEDSPIMEQTKSSEYTVSSSVNMDNTLQHRTQFVVGSSVPSSNTKEEHKEENIPADDASVIGVPEHGPRRRRSADTPKKMAKNIDDNEIEHENEINGIVHVKATKTPATESEIKDNTEDPPTSTTFSYYETSTLYPGQGAPFVDFFRRILELKVKYGLNFLKSATNAFQRYLSGVEERVEASPILNPHY